MTVTTTLDESDPKQHVLPVPAPGDLRLGGVDLTHPACGNAPFRLVWFSLPT